MSTIIILLITLSILIVVSIGITLYIYFTIEDPPELELDEDLFIQDIVDKLEENNKQDEAMAQKVANILNVDKNKQDDILAKKVASLVTKDNKDYNKFAKTVSDKVITELGPLQDNQKTIIQNQNTIYDYLYDDISPRTYLGYVWRNGTSPANLASLNPVNSTGSQMLQ